MSQQASKGGMGASAIIGIAQGAIGGFASAFDKAKYRSPYAGARDEIKRQNALLKSQIGQLQSIKKPVMNKTFPFTSGVQQLPTVVVNASNQSWIKKNLKYLLAIGLPLISVVIYFVARKPKKRLK